MHRVSVDALSDTEHNDLLERLMEFVDDIYSDFDDICCKALFMERGWRRIQNSTEGVRQRIICYCAFPAYRIRDEPLIRL